MKSMRPSRYAIVIISTTFLASSLSMMLRRCDSTVRQSIFSSLAISRLDLAWATSARTSRSRAVSVGLGTDTCSTSAE
jgi:hypothetical protein